MLIHKLVTPSTTNQSNIAHEAKHVAMYLLSLLCCHVLSHRKTLFLHGKGTFYQILLCWLSQHRNPVWTPLFHILSFILTFTLHGLARNDVFTNGFCLWYLYCLNLCDRFVNVTERVITTLIFTRRRGHHLEKWMVTWRARNGIWILNYFCQYAINCCITLDNKSDFNISEYCNIIGMNYPSAAIWLHWEAWWK